MKHASLSKKKKERKVSKYVWETSHAYLFDRTSKNRQCDMRWEIYLAKRVNGLH